MIKKVVYVDLDGVCCNFEGSIKEVYPKLDELDYEARSEKVDEIVCMYPRIFRNLKPIEGAVGAVKKLMTQYEVYFLSTPMWDCPESWGDKRIWVEKYFGQDSNRKLILSHRKDLNLGDYLIDDRIANGSGQFKGELIHFGTKKFPNWDSVTKYLIK